jgi:hypothetical protein
MDAGYTPQNASLALVSESGPEYFVPNNLLRNQAVMNSVRVIEAIRTNQYAQGGFTSAVNAGNGMSDDRLIGILNLQYTMLVALNNKIPNLGVNIGDEQLASMKKRTDELNQFIN